jgi:hypothetical protein
MGTKLDPPPALCDLVQHSALIGSVKPDQIVAQDSVARSTHMRQDPLQSAQAPSGPMRLQTEVAAHLGAPSERPPLFFISARRSPKASRDSTDFVDFEEAELLGNLLRVPPAAPRVVKWDVGDSGPRLRIPSLRRAHIGQSKQGKRLDILKDILEDDTGSLSGLFQRLSKVVARLR